MPMELLVVTPELPYPPVGGFAMRNFQLIKGLAAKHRVTLLTYTDGAADQPAAVLASLGIAVRLVPFGRSMNKRMAQLASVVSPRSYRSTMFYRGAMQRAITALLSARHFDAVLLESSTLERFEFGDVPLVVDEHNLEYEIPQRAARTERSLLRRGFAQIEYRKLQREEQRLWRRARWSVLPSEREVAIVREAGITTTSAVPNGVDLDYFSPAAAGSVRQLVFTGRISYRPNADAVSYFVREILPQITARYPDTSLSVVGADVPAEISRLAGPHVEITGAVPDVRPYLRRASVAIVPIRFGGGTRLKVLEALAMARAVVSTSVGCEGIELIPGRHLLVADGAADFAAAILELFAHPEVGAMLGRRGRALVESRYGWQRMSSLMESVLTSAAQPA